jgi:peptide/nickel transport system substrate-binding protein
MMRAAYGPLGLVLLGLLSACTKDRKDPAPSPGVTPIVAPVPTPNPPFVGELPAGAWVERDFEIGRYGGELALAAAGSPRTFNPILANESSSSLVLGPVFSRCWEYHNLRQEETPGICSAYERSEDGLEYTFTIREGVRWSDGKPITADDFEFSYRLVIDPKIPNTKKDLFRQGTNRRRRPTFPSFIKLDDRHFRFVLKRPDVLFHVLAGSLPVIPKHKWKAVYEQGTYAKAMSIESNLDGYVGSGPFVLEKFVPNQRVVLQRNPYFWKVDPAGNRLPYLDRVIFRIVPDQKAQLAFFRAGDTHLHDVGPEEYEQLKRRETLADYVVRDLGPSFNTHYLMFNLDPRRGADRGFGVAPHRRAWFRRKAFRKAISHAIDRETIVHNVLGGRGRPLWSYVSPANKKWHSEDVVRYPFDLHRAAALLREAGFERRGDVLEDHDGRPVEFSIVTNAESHIRIRMLDYIKADLSRLGIQTYIRPLPFNEVVEVLRNTRKFDAVLLGWGTDVPPDPSFSKNVLFSRGRSHNWWPEQKRPATAWEAEMDRLLHANISHHEFAKRKEYADALYRLFSDELPQIQLVVTHDAAAAHRRIGNFSPSPLRPKTHWNLATLYFKGE